MPLNIRLATHNDGALILRFITKQPIYERDGRRTPSQELT